ncbi:MAG: GNAT family N-acetyltransferase [Ammonifex sp.]|jgi:GNAT superfamily N-acetyltransferase|nr:MAG: GNAT family N-acetyltransferase [Ammonifex sp.]
MKIKEVNVADIPQVARVQVNTWRTAYKGIVSAEYLDSLSYEQSEERMGQLFAEGDKFCYVAQDASGKIAGFAVGGRERTNNPNYKGELYALYVLAEHQGKGTGRLLFMAVARRLQSMGINSMLVWVLTASPYRRFYEKLGGKELEKTFVDVGKEKYEVVSYGWDDLSLLLREA